MEFNPNKRTCIIRSDGITSADIIMKEQSKRKVKVIPDILGLYSPYLLFNSCKDRGDLSILGCKTSSGLKVVTKAVSSKNKSKLFELRRELGNNIKLGTSDYFVSVLWYIESYTGMPILYHHDGTFIKSYDLMVMVQPGSMTLLDLINSLDIDQKILT